MLIVYLTNTSTEYQIWGYYKELKACQSTISKIEKRYDEKLQKIKAECVNILPVQLENRQ